MKMCTTTSAAAPLLTLTYLCFSWYYFSTLPLGWELHPINNLKDDGVFLLKNGPIPASFCLFSSFPHDTVNKSVDGVHGTPTRGSRIEGTDKTTELWRHPLDGVFGSFLYFLPKNNS